MKILILVLSFTKEPYLSLMRSQQSTWDSVEHPDVKTVYYHGGESDTHLIGQNADAFMIDNPGYLEAGFNISDDYFLMAGKFQKALELVKDWEYQYIFRTNSSSYCNKERLVEFSKTLPTENLYAGKTLVDLNDFSGIAISGAGIWLSRDTAEILRKEIDPEFEQEEDIYCGRILRKHGIVPIADESRVDIITGGIADQLIYNADIEKTYHYRFKTSNRRDDAHNMREVHKILTDAG